MPNVLVTGAANGLGAAFVEAYRSQPNTTVIAIDRLAIPATHQNVFLHTIDLTDEKAINTFANQISTTKLDLIVHSAGIRGLVPSLEAQHPNDVGACETLAGMDTATMTRTFQINTVATFAFLRALLPSLRQAENPKVVVMSSRMGSLHNNAAPNPSAGAAYAYRASKAAVNTILRSFAVDVPDVAFVLCHPGRVETKLVQGKEDGAIEAEESVRGIVRLIQRWDLSDSGKFYDRFGEVIQW